MATHRQLTYKQITATHLSLQTRLAKTTGTNIHTKSLLVVVESLHKYFESWDIESTKRKLSS